MLGTIGALAPEHDAAGHVFVTTGSPVQFAEQLTNLIGVEARATAAVWEGSSLRIGYLISRKKSKGRNSTDNCDYAKWSGEDN